MYLNTNSCERYLKYQIQMLLHTSKFATRTNVCFQNYFYYANQIIIMLTTLYSVLSFYTLKLNLV